MLKGDFLLRRCSSSSGMMMTMTMMMMMHEAEGGSVIHPFNQNDISKGRGSTLML